MIIVNPGDLHMPRRRTIFASDHYYHIYNRGVEKRIIFENKNDFLIFLEILKFYLTPSKTIPQFFSRTPRAVIPDSVSLLCYCLMPNHFHFLLQQKQPGGIVSLMNSLGITYAKYFNKKYKRVGGLFQGRFKAKLVNKDEYLLQLSKYIHLNPKELSDQSVAKYPFSSYRVYLKQASENFLHTDFILNYFTSQQKNLSYQAFVEEIEPDFLPIKTLMFK